MLDFLTDEEREALTGLRRPSYQRRWLAENGIFHWVRADGVPVIPRSAITQAGDKQTEKRQGPNLDGLASGQGGA